MIALDFDGVVANYGDHTTQLRFNGDLFRLLPRPQPVAICTNQGGMAFSFSSPDRYPTPQRIAYRLFHGCAFLEVRGYFVQRILIAAYHPKASEHDIERAARQLQERLQPFLFDCDLNIYTTEQARKPSPFMLWTAEATMFYGDSSEDAQAAEAAGIPFVSVPRFL